MKLIFICLTILISSLSFADAPSANSFNGFSLPMELDYGDSKAGQIDNFVKTLEVKDTVRLSSGEVVALPLIWWNTPYLKLWGTADAVKLKAILAEQGHNVEPVPFPNLGGQALVFVGSVDFHGVSLKPVRVFTTAALVMSDSGVPGLFYWHYYSDNPTNNLFKSEVWGIPAQHGTVENYYSKDIYASRMKDAKGIESNFVWKSFDPKRLQATLDSNPITSPPEEANIFVTGDKIRRTSFGINGKFIGAGSLFSPDGKPSAPETLFPFNPEKGDQLNLGAESPMKKDLDEVSFTPMAWELWSNSGGEILIEKRQ